MSNFGFLGYLCLPYEAIVKLFSFAPIWHLKQNRPGRVSANIRLFQYPITRTYVCILHLFAIYRLPKPYESRHSYLLPISCKPHNKVSSSTIGRWLKEVLCRAGIDTSVYQAHSTRSASTSKASAVVPVDVIMTLAGWSQESSFRKHYDKSVAVTDQMSNAVLDQLNF